MSSAGDNTLTTHARGPALVVTADISPAQLACVELRKAAFLNLSHGAVPQFLGAREGSGRMRTYERPRGSINETARRFRDGRRELIEAGVIHSGKFEHYFRPGDTGPHPQEPVPLRCGSREGGDARSEQHLEHPGQTFSKTVEIQRLYFHGNLHEVEEFYSVQEKYFGT